MLASSLQQAGAGRMPAGEAAGRRRRSAATLSDGEHARRLEGAGDAVLGEAVRRLAGEARAEREQLARGRRDTPESALRKVVLPAPFGPITPTSSPGANAALTASTAVRPPKRTVSARASRGDGRSSRACQRIDASRPAGRAPRGSAARRATSCRPAASARRSVSARRLNTIAATSGPHSVVAPPISAISTVWKPMNGLNTVAGSM
jgi:hypothetical protein